MACVQKSQMVFQAFPGPVKGLAVAPAIVGHDTHGDNGFIAECDQGVLARTRKRKERGRHSAGVPGLQRNVPDLPRPFGNATGQAYSGQPFTASEGRDGKENAAEDQPGQQ